MLDTVRLPNGQGHIHVLVYLNSGTLINGSLSTGSCFIKTSMVVFKSMLKIWALNKLSLIDFIELKIFYGENVLLADRQNDLDNKSFCTFFIHLN